MINANSRKNLIITGELYDTQYTFIENFNNHYIQRKFTEQIIASNIDDYLSYISKEDKDEIKSLDYLYNSHSLYCTLLSIMVRRLFTNLMQN